MSARQKPTRLRPSEALAGGGGRYRYAEVRPDSIGLITDAPLESMLKTDSRVAYPDAEPMPFGDRLVASDKTCNGCGFHQCGCPPLGICQTCGDQTFAALLSQGVCGRCEDNTAQAPLVRWFRITVNEWDPVLRAIRVAFHQPGCTVHQWAEIRASDLSSWGVPESAHLDAVWWCDSKVMGVRDTTGTKWFAPKPDKYSTWPKPEASPTPPPDDGLVWEEVLRSEFDMSYRAWLVATVDGSHLRVRRRDVDTLRGIVAGDCCVRPGDTVAVGNSIFAFGLNGRRFS